MLLIHCIITTCFHVHNKRLPATTHHALSSQADNDLQQQQQVVSSAVRATAGRSFDLSGSQQSLLCSDSKRDNNVDYDAATHPRMIDNNNEKV